MPPSPLSQPPLVAMPLTPNRPRAGSRPAPPVRLLSTRAKEVSLQEENLPEADDWEPVSGEPGLALGEIQGAVTKWEEELKVRGREISGRTMCVPPALASYRPRRLAGALLSESGGRTAEAA